MQDYMILDYMDNSYIKYKVLEKKSQKTEQSPFALLLSTFITALTNSLPEAI